MVELEATRKLRYGEVCLKQKLCACFRMEIFVPTRPRAGLRPAGPSGIVGRVHLLAPLN